MNGRTACPYFLGEAFKSCYLRVAVNRSPNRIANWFMAAFQSKVALTHLVGILRSASRKSLMAAPSGGISRLDDLRSRIFKLSMAFVV